ncbi:hypothetical protein GCM10011487_49540 [Steroidobacter agaridevorans]|uniref:Glycerophosphoryl diester phosphodiesterase membrane domain-containing protein n=1 Tax=Steroidobacter agaridevorans TaxID=2695856 RepID=A0A829YI03_9GAMM|nr:DUF6159 family protein [Steroidobacter agaridevorans]GFE82954.1 hypothetical protein GCM10011487_49540 [Steroidobacter agaridevorans]
MFARFSRSWQLVKASATVLQQDKELLLFPVFSAVATLLVAASFLVPLLFTGTLDELRGWSNDATSLLVLFLFYLVQYFVIFFFNSALVGAAMIRLDGGDPTVADGLRIARSRIVQILGYAAIAATVGMILRLIEERAGFIGRWIAGLLGVAFTAATFLAVPVLVSRDVGPMDAVKDSAALLKKTWGENIIGNVGIGLVFFLFYLGALGLGVVFMLGVSQTGSGPLFIAVLSIVVLAVVGLALVQAALQGVYSAALYRYATEGNVGDAFAGPLLSDAFRQKR